MSEEVLRLLAEGKTYQDDFCYGLFGGESVKWYESDKDLKRLSEALPDLIIKIEGKGEEAEDLWREVWLNGQCIHEVWSAPDLGKMVAKLRGDIS